MYEAHISATATQFVNDDGDTLEEHGWIIPSWSMTELYEEKPECEEKFDTHEEALEWIKEQVGEVEDTDSSRGNYYASDSVTTYDDGQATHYSYCGHISEVE